ncbi:hypothetical protein CU097_009929, partial [Rhizopus azygosporus]
MNYLIRFKPKSIHNLSVTTRCSHYIINRHISTEIQHQFEEELSETYVLHKKLSGARMF